MLQAPTSSSATGNIASSPSRTPDASQGFNWIVGPGEGVADSLVTLKFDENGQNHTLRQIEYGSQKTGITRQKTRQRTAFYADPARQLRLTPETTRFLKSPQAPLEPDDMRSIAQRCFSYRFYVELGTLDSTNCDHPRTYNAAAVAGRRSMT